MPSDAGKLFAVYSALRGHFGYHPRWWPGEPVDVFLSAVLVQRGTWEGAWAAVTRLRSAGLHELRRLADAAPGEVEATIARAALHRQKAPRLVAIAGQLRAWGFERVEPFLCPRRDTAAVRRQLLELPGIGNETADCCLLFASAHPSFVVDEYTARAFERLDLFPEMRDAFRRRRYGPQKEFFERTLRQDPSLYDCFDWDPEVPREVALFRDFHAQLVELGKHHCRKRPRCRQRGAAGWTGYPPCATHCQPGRCAACPLAGSCGWPSADGPGEPLPGRPAGIPA